MNERPFDRIALLAGSKDRFTYDVRGNCLVYGGIVASYRPTWNEELPGALNKALRHALDNDGILHVRHDSLSGQACYESCRLFTDLSVAMRFARQEGRSTVLNLHRGELVQLDPPLIAA